MSNVTPIKIDTTDGRLPLKEKGLVFRSLLILPKRGETNLRNLLQDLGYLIILDLMKVWLDISLTEILNLKIIFG